MNIVTETLSDTRKAYTVEFPSEAVDQQRKQSLKSLAQQVRIPGFRPGKAPADLLERRYAQEIKDDLNRALTQRAVDAVIEQEKSRLESIVEVGDLEADLSGGNGHKLRVVADLVPEFDLPEYVAIPVEVQEVVVTDEDVDGALENLRRERADFQPAERPAARGDFVKIAYEGTYEGKPLAEVFGDVGVYGSQSATWEEIGGEGNVLPGISAALEGASVGDSRELDESFDDNHSVEALRGKTVHYKVEVQEIRERKLPALNEEFFKSMRVEGLDELREGIRRNLTSEANNRNEEEKRRQVLAHISKVEFSVPESLIERHTQRALRRMVDDNMRRGVSQEILEQHREEIFNEAQRNAENQARIDLILQRIAEKESIQVSQQDLSERIYMQAYYSGQDPKKLVNELKKDRSRLTSLQSEILLSKTLSWLVEKANISSGGTTKEA